MKVLGRFLFFGFLCLRLLHLLVFTNFLDFTSTVNIFDKETMLNFKNLAAVAVLLSNIDTAQAQGGAWTQCKYPS